MTRRARFCFISLFTIGSLALVSCGSDGPPATASPGSKFCTLALAARQAGQAMDISASPDDLKKQIEEGVRTSTLAAAQAPKDFQDIAKRTLATQGAFVKLLEENNYDMVTAMTSDEGKKLINDPEFSKVDDDRKAYLQDKCDIAPSDSTNAPALSLGSGDEGIRKLFKLLQIAPGFNITDDQVECAVENLSGNLSEEEIKAIATQEGITDDINLKLGLAVQKCEIGLPGT